MFMVTGGLEFGTEDATSYSCLDPPPPTIFSTSVAAVSKTLIHSNILLFRLSALEKSLLATVKYHDLLPSPRR